MDALAFFTVPEFTQRYHFRLTTKIEEARSVKSCNHPSGLFPTARKNFHAIPRIFSTFVYTDSGLFNQIYARAPLDKTGSRASRNDFPAMEEPVDAELMGEEGAEATPHQTWIAVNSIFNPRKQPGYDFS